MILYSQPGCGPCIGLKRKLTSDGHVFEEINVQADEAARNRIKELGYSGTPVVEYTDSNGERQHFHGFQAKILEGIKADLEAA